MKITFAHSGPGCGKTAAGADWVIELASMRAAAQRGVAIVGSTMSHVQYLIEGEQGILRRSAPTFRPIWVPSRRLLTWPNGEWACTYSADRPDRFRGVQHAFGWADEVYCQDWDAAIDQLELGLRLGTSPGLLVTTTPAASLRQRVIIGRASDVFGIEQGHFVTRGYDKERALATINRLLVESIENAPAFIRDPRWKMVLERLAT